MRLDWFSPLPPAPTDIARSMAQLLPALAARAEVRLWTDRDEWDPALEELAEVRRYRADQVPWEELNRSDLCIYHLGNAKEFHAAIWSVSRRHSGLVVLHDPERYPLTSLALENALGVLVHSRPAFDALAERNRWPVIHAPLPCPADLERDRSPASPEAYAQAITGFAAKAGLYRRTLTAWDLADRAGEEMGRWADPDGMEGWRSTAAAIRDLLLEGDGGGEPEG